MAAINFPIPTQVGELHTQNNQTWRWDGVTWESNTFTGPGPTGPAGGPTGPSGALTAWTVKTGNYTLVNGDRIIANTSGGGFTLTLPATPTPGISIQVTDGDDWSVNHLTIARNGSTIEGNSDDLLLDVQGIMVELVYDGTTWQVILSIGSQGATGPAGEGSVGPTGPAGSQGATGPTGSGGLTWMEKTTTYTAAAGNAIFANTTSGPFTITLPSSPLMGDTVYFADSAGTWNLNNLTVARNGQTIMDLNEDLICDKVRTSFSLVYTGNTWIII